MKTKTVKIAEAKNNLSRYLKYVQKGGRVRILDRDRPVAEIVPVSPRPSGDDDDELLAWLVEQGIVHPPEKPGPLPASVFRAKPRGRGSIIKTLLRERERSW